MPDPDAVSGGEICAGQNRTRKAEFQAKGLETGSRGRWQRHLPWFGT
jgi:hypothetical protein